MAGRAEIHEPDEDGVVDIGGEETQMSTIEEQSIDEVDCIGKSKPDTNQNT